MTRRFLFASLFLGIALASTGCCGALRNCIHRFRANHGCYPAIGAPCCDAGPAFSPSYSIGAPGVADPGCAGCGAANLPAGAVPGYAGAVPIVPPGGNAALLSGTGAKIAGGK
jgi:hypothetical protein